MTPFFYGTNHNIFGKKRIFTAPKFTYKMSTIVAPSLLAANFLNLEKDIELVNNSEAQWLHLDVMDGVFVPNISFGFPVLKAVQSKSTSMLDVHVMAQNPDQYVTEFKKVGTNILTVHYEACTHLHRTVQLIQSEGMKAGVALNPHTPVSVLSDIIQDLDLILIMSVNPGFGGQKFIPHTIKKVQDCKKLIETTNSKALIEIDGGVNTENAPSLVAAGANVLVAGSAVFKAADPVATIANIASN